MTDIDLKDNSFDNFNRKLSRRSMPKKRRPQRERKRVKTTIYDYLASRVPADAYFVLSKFGKYRRARDERELAYQLRDFVRTFGEKGLNELAQIHPDRKLLEIHCSSCKKKSEMKRERMYNFIEQKDIMEYNNASGNKNVPTEKDSNSKMLILGGFILMGIALIVKK
jgi:hypothetical protein|tara:strand:+ start:6062 stop:6562 length:501 start_codon:yes stop_codon:yes gene_type:complete